MLIDADSALRAAEEPRLSNAWMRCRRQTGDHSLQPDGQHRHCLCFSLSFQLLIPRDSIKIYISKIQMFFSLVEWSKCHGGSKVQPGRGFFHPNHDDLWGAISCETLSKNIVCWALFIWENKTSETRFFFRNPWFFSGKPPLETVKDPLKCLLSTKPTISSFANVQRQATGGQNPFREKGAL